MKFLCWIMGHKYKYKKRLSDFSHLVECKRCNNKFCMNTSNKILLEWDLEMEDFYRSTFPEFNQER